MLLGIEIIRIFIRVYIISMKIQMLVRANSRWNVILIHKMLSFQLNFHLCMDLRMICISNFPFSSLMHFYFDSWVSTKSPLFLWMSTRMIFFIEAFDHGGNISKMGFMNIFIWRMLGYENSNISISSWQWFFYL